MAKQKTQIGEIQNLIRKIGITLLSIGIYIILSYIPIPFLNIEILSNVNALNLFDSVILFTSGAIQKVMMMSNGISAYISASIIIQLLMNYNKSLLIQSRSAGGDRKIKQLTITYGLIISGIMSIFTIIPLQQQYQILTVNIFIGVIVGAIVQLFGTYIAVKLGFLIEEKGIGNGMSILIVLNILSNLPMTIRYIEELSLLNNLSIIQIVLSVLMILIVLMILVWVESSELHVPLVNTKSYLTENSRLSQNEYTLPFKINEQGVMPLIIASILIQMFYMFIYFINSFLNLSFLNSIQSYSSPFYLLLLSIFIYVGAKAYSHVTFDAEERYNLLQRNSRLIKDVEMGDKSIQYLTQVHEGLTNIGIVILIGLASIPFLLNLLFGITLFSSTSILIVIGVSLNIITTIQNELKIVRLANEKPY